MTSDVMAGIADILRGAVGDGHEIVPDVQLSDLGLDSMKTIQIFMSLEEAFDIEFDDEDLKMDNFRTPLSIYKIVQKTLGLEHVA